MSSRPELSVEVIVEVATDIAESEGFEALSMRRLATELGVSPMAFYKHVETKDALLDLIGNRYLAELDLAEGVEAWDERLERIFVSFHDLLLRRPVLAHVMLSQPVSGPSAYLMTDVVLGVLHDHGFGDADAVEILGALGSYTVGLTLAHLSRTAEGNATQRLQRIGEVSDHPHLTRAASDFVSWPGEGAFEDGLRILIRGYAERV